MYRITWCWCYYCCCCCSVAWPVNASLFTLPLCLYFRSYRDEGTGMVMPLHVQHCVSCVWASVSNFLHCHQGCFITNYKFLHWNKCVYGHGVATETTKRCISLVWFMLTLACALALALKYTHMCHFYMTDYFIVFFLLLPFFCDAIKYSHKSWRLTYEYMRLKCMMLCMVHDWRSMQTHTLTSYTLHIYFHYVKIINSIVSFPSPFLCASFFAVDISHCFPLRHTVLA